MSYVKQKNVSQRKNIASIGSNAKCGCVPLVILVLLEEKKSTLMIWSWKEKEKSHDMPFITRKTCRENYKLYFIMFVVSEPLKSLYFSYSEESLKSLYFFYSEGVCANLNGSSACYLSVQPLQVFISPSPTPTPNSMWCFFSFCFPNLISRFPVEVQILKKIQFRWCNTFLSSGTVHEVNKHSTVVHRMLQENLLWGERFWKSKLP